MSYRGVPQVIAFDDGPNVIGPMLMRFGSEQQKRRHLPAIARADVFWCQAYTEPGPAPTWPPCPQPPRLTATTTCSAAARSSWAAQLAPTGRTCWRAQARRTEQAPQSRLLPGGHALAGHQPDANRGGPRQVRHAKRSGVRRRARARREPAGRPRRGLAGGDERSRPRAVRHRECRPRPGAAGGRDREHEGDRAQRRTLAPGTIRRCAGSWRRPR